MCLSFFFSKLLCAFPNPNSNNWYQSRISLPEQRRQHPPLHLLRFGRGLTGVRRSTNTRGEPKGLGILRFLIRAHFGLRFCYCQYCAGYFVLLCKFFDCDRFYKTGLLQSSLHCGIHYRLVWCRFYLKHTTFASSTVNSNG